MIKNIVKNVEARVYPISILILLIGIAFTTIFIVGPYTSDIKGATVDQFIYYKPITISASQVVGQSQTDFVICINLSSDTDLAADCLNSGWDIAFFNSSTNVQLSHEIEIFNGATGQFVAWVEVDDISAFTDTVINMYYGDNDIGSSAEDVAGTWSNNYDIVVHFNESSSPLEDSISANQYAESGNPTYAQTGPSGKTRGYAVDYDGTTDDNTDTSPAAIADDDKSVTCWLYVDDEDDRGSVFHDNIAFEFDGTAKSALVLARDFETDEFQLQYKTNDAGNNYKVSVEFTSSLNTWYCVQGRYDKTAEEMRAFSNGLYIGSDSNANMDVIDYDANIYLGDGSNDRPWNGYVDELRLHSTLRTNNWFKTEYNSINNATDGGFFTLGSESLGEGYEIGGLDTNTRFSFNGTEGSTVWANGSGATTETLVIYTNISGTGDTCTDIFLDFSDIDSDIVQENFSVEVRNITDGVWDGTTTQVPSGDGNVTINATTWAGGWCHGTSPFPITTDTAIEIRVKCEIPSGKAAGTYTTDSWEVVWKVTT